MKLAGKLALGVTCLAAMSIAAQAAEPTVLTVFAAGTLAVPFREIDEAFQQKHGDRTVHAEFGGSVKMAKQITDLHQAADILAVADFSVIPKYLFGAGGQTAYADWYAGFAAYRKRYLVPISRRTDGTLRLGTQQMAGLGGMRIERGSAFTESA